MEGLNKKDIQIHRMLLLIYNTYINYAEGILIQIHRMLLLIQSAAHANPKSL